MRGFNPRWEYSRRARNFRDADGPEFARIVEERDRELEEYLDQHDDRISSLETGGVGQKGEKGDPGEDGADGLPGIDGNPGADGKDGAPGADGQDGADGADGQDVDASAYLPLTGGTLTGNLNSSATIKANNGLIGLSLDSGQSSNLLLKHNSQTKVYVGSTLTTFQEKLKLNKEGTDDNHAVTKGYVDSAAAAAGGVDLDADYNWNGNHRFYGGETLIDNEHGPLTFDGYKSDYSGEEHGHAFLKFRENANSENWMYFGPTSAYWEARWTLGAGEMTFAQTHTSSPSVKITKNGLQVNGSSVSRNATILSALRSSASFDELKAKLIELLEAEEVASDE